MRSNLNITSIPSTSSISSKPNDEEEADEKVKRKGKGGKEGKGDREEKNRERSIVVPKFTPISPSAPPALWTATPPPHYPGGGRFTTRSAHHSKYPTNPSAHLSCDAPGSNHALSSKRRP